MISPSDRRGWRWVEPAAYWILEELGEDTAAVEQVNDVVHKLAGVDVTEQDLAAFLEIAGFVERKEDAPHHANWGRWLPHRMALSWQGEQVDRSGSHRRRACEH